MIFYAKMEMATKLLI